MKNFHPGSRNTEADRTVAYFSAEYALSPTLPIYAGGLGVLAGDYVREAGDRNFPLVPIGLLYKNAQSMLKPEHGIDEERIIEPLLNKDGEEIRISILIGQRTVRAAVHQWKHESVTVYLLDADVPENDPDDRKITSDLYTDIRADRLRQEILLGIGGFELLSTLGLTPSVYHLNEGHSAFVSLALIKQKMEKSGLDFKSAKELAKQEIVFTNHTLILEGQEMFTRELLNSELSAYARSMSIEIEDIWRLGSTKDNKMFSMTTLAFHMSSGSNAVSMIHGEKAQILWPEDHPTAVVTNGIYIPRWDKVKNDVLKDHANNKKILLEYIEKTTSEKWQEGILLFGWARRFVEYKQPLLILQDIEKIKEMMKDSQKPFRIVYSGPTGIDPNSNPLIFKLQKLIEDSLKGLVVFLPNYNTGISELMTSGCDVWLNTPVVGREACGTSGMKAALNGTLPLSTRDGWIAEVDLSDCGWVIDEPDVNQKLLAAIEKEIVPVFYDKRSEWQKRMQNARLLIQERFSAARMLQDYDEKLYAPILKKGK